jgi:hypothetical protein
MLVFVHKSALTLASDEKVNVSMYCEDNVTPPPNMDSNLVALRLPASALIQTATLPTLAPGWRNTYRIDIINSEAERRILAAFPEHAQRNAIAEIQRAMMQHGADIKAWPEAAKRRQGELARLWDYVDAVRTKANAMLSGALPANPSADSHWPAAPRKA